MLGWIAEEPALEPYRFHLRRRFRDAARAGADLEDPETIRSVPRRLEAWVERLEGALGERGGARPGDVR